MTASVALTDLAGPALVRAFNDLAARVGQDQVKRFSDRTAGVKRATKLLETHFANCDVFLSADGFVSVMARHQPVETPAEPETTGEPKLVATHGDGSQLVSYSDVESKPAQAELDDKADADLADGERTALLDAAQREAFAATERRQSPGMARLKANLGEAGAEALRQQVLDDSDAALAAAAKRPGATAPADASTRPADGPAESPTVAKPADKPAADKPAAVAKPAKAPAKPAGRAPLFGETDVIRYLLTGDAPNPKRGTAAARFAHYRDGITVADYIAAVGDRKQALRDLAWDTKQKWVAVEGAKPASAGK